jgi:hypothetical protein
MGLWERVVRVLRLDDSVFEEVAHDELATGSALIVLLGAAALDAAGSAGGLEGRLYALAATAAHAALWIVFIHFGARTLGLSDTFAPLFRAAAFAQAPLAVGLFDALPGVGSVVWIAKWALVFATTVLATSRALPEEGVTPAVLCAAALGVALLAVEILL